LFSSCQSANVCRSAIDGATGLVAELEEVGKEEGEIGERLVRAGHVAAGVLALVQGVVPVLDAARAQACFGEEGDVAGCVDIGIRGLQDTR
jgi:hypothetical protein